MLLFISILGGYLVGSIPTAFIAVRLKAGIDVRKAGSGNVGALNAYAVTQSKRTGIIIGLLDGAKGFIVALIAGQLLGGSFWILSVALFGAIIGHNYPMWLQFRGGRGLATALGGLCVIGASYIMVWCVIWLIAYKSIKHVLKANLTAILLTPIIILVIPSTWIEAVMMHPAPATDYRIFSFIMSGIHLLSHLNPSKEIIGAQRYT